MKRFVAIAIVGALFAAGCNNNAQKPTEKQKVDAQKFFNENIAKVENLCKEKAAQDVYDLDAASYTFIDIDSDGVDELYIRDENSDCGWLLCCGADTLQFVASENYKLHFSRLGNVIMLSGSAGTGTFYSGYFQIENSSYTGPDFYELEEYVFASDTTKTVYYPLGDYDNEYPEEKTKLFFENLAKIKASGADWELLAENIKWNPFYELTGRIPEDV